MFTSNFPKAPALSPPRLLRHRRDLLTYEGAPLGVEFAGRADAGAQVQHDEHGGDHHGALHQQQRLEVAAKSVGGKASVDRNKLKVSDLKD